MTCPKCGSGMADGASQCGICFFNLEQGGAPQAADAPLAFRMPAAPTYVPQDELVAGIPGIDNQPKMEPMGGGAAPLPGVGLAPLPGAGSGQFKVSLTGEMIEVPSAMPSMSTRTMDGRQPGSPAGSAGNGALPPPVGIRPQVGAPPPPRSASSMPARSGSSQRRISPRPAADEYARPKSKAGPIIAAIVVLLLAGGGAFGWFYWQKTHGPQGAVSDFFTAIKNKDAKKVIQLIEVPSAQKSLVTESLVSQQLTMLSGMVTFKEIKVGDATINGDTGTVKADLTVTLSDSMKGMAAAFGGKGGDAGGDKTQSATIPVIKVNGAWKVDGSKGGALGSMGGFGN